MGVPVKVIQHDTWHYLRWLVFPAIWLLRLALLAAVVALGTYVAKRIWSGKRQR